MNERKMNKNADEVKWNSCQEDIHILFWWGNQLKTLMVMRLDFDDVISA